MSEPSPRLTVVIAATDSTAAARSTLDSVQPSDGIECLVVGPSDRISRPPGDGPGHWVLAAPGTTVPRLRRIGLDAARGPIVLFTEDSCRLSAGFLDAYLDAFRDESIASVSGPVIPAMGQRPIDWAVYFCEYAIFAPCGSRPPGRLVGNNFAIRSASRTAIDAEVIEESEVPRMGMTWRPDARVEHVRRYAVDEALRDRLRFAFSYGRRRYSARPWPIRLAGLVGGPAILAAQWLRIARIVAGRRSLWGPALDTFPITLALLAAWSLGEWLGWMASAWPSPPSGTPHERAGRPDDRTTGPAAT